MGRGIRMVLVMLCLPAAAERLPGTASSPDAPVAFWGYSQGWGAAASTAETAQDHTPELGIVGTYASAPPVRLRAVPTRRLTCS